MQTFTQDRTATGSVSVVRDLSRVDLKTSFVQSLLSAKSSHPLLCDAGLSFQPAAWHPETLRNSLAEIVYICDPLSHFGELLGGRARCTSFIDSLLLTANIVRLQRVVFEHVVAYHTNVSRIVFSTSVRAM